MGNIGRRNGTGAIAAGAAIGLTIAVGNTGIDLFERDAPGIPVLADRGVSASPADHRQPLVNTRFVSTTRNTAALFAPAPAAVEPAGQDAFIQLAALPHRHHASGEASTSVAAVMRRIGSAPYFDEAM